mmetsp:Transcript_26200/g.40614  ORF Transcript_26200/g.40614 Transcript_26200/m.40614 type:complete len:103 (+) Transcript_26200:1353-1661(+)
MINKRVKLLFVFTLAHLVKGNRNNFFAFRLPFVHATNEDVKEEKPKETKEVKHLGETKAKRRGPTTRDNKMEKSESVTGEGRFNRWGWSITDIEKAVKEMFD